MGAAQNLRSQNGATDPTINVFGRIRWMCGSYFWCVSPVTKSASKNQKKQLGVMDDENNPQSLRSPSRNFRRYIPNDLLISCTVLTVFLRTPGLLIRTSYRSPPNSERNKNKRTTESQSHRASWTDFSKPPFLPTESCSFRTCQRCSWTLRHTK